jgi:AraC-like DNA-binding protein
VKKAPSKIGNMPSACLDQGEDRDCAAFQQRFDDVDSFQNALALWDLSFQQLDRGKFYADLTHFESPGLLLTRSRFNRKVLQNGSHPAGYRTFGIPAHDTLQLRWRGRDCCGRSLMLFPESRELDSVSEAGFEVYTVSIPQMEIDQAAEALGMPTVDTFFSDTRAVTYPLELRLRLRGLTSQIADHGLLQPALRVSSTQADELEFSLIECLFAASSHGTFVDSPPLPGSRRRILRRALQEIHDRAHEPIKVSDLQRSTGFSIRTLRYAFAEDLGVSPKRYILMYRLNNVRRELMKRTTAPGVISDVANAWGFWHLGQFARDYHQAFYELPSATLAQY